MLEEAAGVMMAIAGLWYVLSAWDVNIGERGNPVTAFIDTTFIIFISWMLYRAVIVYINHQLEEEGEDAK